MIFFFKIFYFIFLSSHPMFPMVELLFHECEQQTSCATRENRFHLEEEISNFGRRLELEQIPLFINDTELDSLMIKAVQGNIIN